MRDRIYICHTYYHVYVACLKEFARPSEYQGRAELMLSTMSTDFKDLGDRAKESGIFAEVHIFREKAEDQYPELVELKKDTGSLLGNLRQRMRHFRRLSELTEPLVPVDLREYRDIYVFCDSDPIGYYLAGHKIRYHAVEDGLDCLKYLDSARYDNRGHFALKAQLAAMGLIFIQNGYSRYCIDMEVNDLSVLESPGPKAVEVSRRALTERLTAPEKQRLTKLFIANKEELTDRIDEAKAMKVPLALVLSEPLCALPVREKLFKDLIRENTVIDGRKAVTVIKPHPRDLLDYEAKFPETIVLDRYFPMEILNFLEGVTFDRVVTVYTVPDLLSCAREKVYLGDDFMDRYEAPEIHRQNEQI